MNKLLIVTILLLCWGSARSQIELPRFVPSDSIIVNAIGRYTLKYSPDHRISAWVAYKLTTDDIAQGTERAGNFTIDKVAQSRGFEVATTADYTHSGYDRGHLLPSGDRTKNEQQNKATFVLSNCAPQRPALNRGTWKSLEEQVRRWAANYDTIYVVCGALLADSLPKVGRGVSVPNTFFKAVLLRKGDSFKTNCYLMPNDEALERDINYYKVSQDSLEKVTGLDLFWRIQKK